MEERKGDTTPFKDASFKEETYIESKSFSHLIICILFHLDPMPYSFLS